MDLTQLTRDSYRRDRPTVPFLGRFSLAGARAHEICGSARRRLTLWLAHETHGPIMWIRPAWHPDRLHMDGVRPEIDPGRLIFVDAVRVEDMLWTMEESLRAGVVPLVVADLAEPPGLVAVRRLHLAAESGAASTKHAALAILLTPGRGGAPGVETRWQLETAHISPSRHRWQLERIRARQAPPGQWLVEQSHGGRAKLTVERRLTDA